MWEAVRVERVAEIRGWVAQYRFIARSTIDHGRRAWKLLQEGQEEGVEVELKINEGGG
jgi:hypothetical protein